MPEDVAITWSKSDVDPCTHAEIQDRQKSVDGRTDGFSALLLYYSRYGKVHKFARNMCNKESCICKIFVSLSL